MATDALAPELATRKWRVTPDHADAVPALRDYLQRLGAAADARGPDAVEFETDVPDHELDEWVASWVNANRVVVQLAPVERPPRRLLPFQPRTETPRLGELLVRKGFITEEQLAWALGEARATNTLLGIVLLREQMIFEDELARTLSEQLDVPYVSVLRIGIDPYVVRLLPAEAGEAAAAIPVRVVDSTVQVAFADPTDERALSIVSAHLPRITVGVAELSDIRLAWREVERAARGGSRPR